VRSRARIRVTRQIVRPNATSTADQASLMAVDMADGA
jgi:hypothetical protein